MALPPDPAPCEIGPELAERAAALGLEDAFRQLEADGYTVIEDVASPEFVGRLRETILEHHARIKLKGSGPRLLIGKDSVFSEAAINPGTHRPPRGRETPPATRAQDRRSRAPRPACC